MSSSIGPAGVSIHGMCALTDGNTSLAQGCSLVSATVVISGLVTSTLLTLVVVPALFKWFDEKPIEA